MREKKWGRGREKGRQRIWSRLCTDSRKLNVGLEPTNREIMTWAEVRHLTYWATQAFHHEPFLNLALCLLCLHITLHGIANTDFHSKLCFPIGGCFNGIWSSRILQQANGWHTKDYAQKHNTESPREMQLLFTCYIICQMKRSFCMTGTCPPFSLSRY